jgi:hypothetical protein
MIPILYNSWKDYFTNQPMNDQGNRNLAGFIGVMSGNKSRSDRLKSLTEGNTIFLMADADRKIIIGHGPTNFGGTRTRPENKVGALVGLGAAAQGILLVENSALASYNLVTPSTEELFECASKDELGAFEDQGDLGDTTFSGSGIFIPAPFLFEKFIAMDSRDPLDLILEARAAATSFDLDHAGDDEYDSAKEHAGDFMKWAWAVEKGKVLESRYSVHPDDGELNTHCSYAHAFNIMPPTGNGTMPPGATPFGTEETGDNSAVLRQLAEGISRQTEEAERSNMMHREDLNRRKEKDEEKRDKTKKLHRSTVSMLLMASATTNERAAPKLVQTATDFFNSENTGLADMELSQNFAAIGLKEVNFAHGVVQAFHSGQFTYFNPSAPSNFTIFAFTEREPLSSDLQSRTMFLHLAATQGKGKTLDEIKSSAKQVVSIPTDFDAFLRQIYYFLGAFKIFFGPDSLGSMSIQDLHKEVSENRMHFRAKIACDKKFAAKFLFAVDTKVQRWLDHCKHATDRSEVDDRILNFGPMIEDVLDNRFNVELPASFKLSTDDEVVPVVPGQPPLKRKKDDAKKGEKGEDLRIVNPNQCKDFVMKEGESWTETFCGKCAKDRPSWSSTARMCVRWHTKGDCFADCRNAESHVACSEIPQARKEEYKGFMKKARHN